MVENGTLSAVLHESQSDHVKLIKYSVDESLGVFLLLSHHADRRDWIPAEWLLGFAEAKEGGITPGSAVTCIGYCGHVRKVDEERMLDVAGKLATIETGILSSKVDQMEKIVDQ